MPRIQRYQQDRLASSQVGTPGIDQSGDIIANSIQQTAAAGAAGSLAIEQDAITRRADLTANVGSLGGALGAGIATGLAIKAATEKQLRTAKGNALANDASFEFAVEESKLRQRLRNEAGLDTTGMLDKYNKGVAELEASTARKYNLTDDKGNVADGAQAFFTQYNGKANTTKLSGTKWIEDYTWSQDTKLITANTKYQAEQLSQSMQNADSREEALKLYREFLNPDTVRKYEMYMPGGISDMNRDLKNAAMNFEMSQAAKDPTKFDDTTGKFVDGAAVKAIKDGTWKNLFDASDNKAILAEDARQRDKLLDQQKEENELGNQQKMYDGASAIVEATNWRANADNLQSAKSRFTGLLVEEQNKPLRFRSEKFTNYIVSGLKYIESLETASKKEAEAINQYNEMIDRGEADRFYSNHAHEKQMEDEAAAKIANSAEALTFRAGLDKTLEDMQQRVALAGKGGGAKVGISLNDMADVMTKLNEGYTNHTIDAQNYKRLQAKAADLTAKVTPKQLLPGTPKESFFYFPDQPPPNYLINAINPKMGEAERQKLREELHKAETEKLKALPANANNLMKQLMRKNAEIEILHAHVKAVTQGVPSPLHIDAPQKAAATKRTPIKTTPFSVPGPPPTAPSLVPDAPGGQ